MSRVIDFNKLPVNSRLFLAEGSSEVGLLEAIIQELGVDRAFVYDAKGEKLLDTVLKRLRDEIEARSPLDCLGIVFDANTDAGAKLDSIAALLASADVQYEKDKIDDCGVYKGGRFPVGVFISPGGKPGIIETMILEEIKTRPGYDCIVAFEECVREKTGRVVDEKGSVQIFLGSHNAAHGIAVAFQKGLFDANHAAYEAVWSMVQRLSS